MLTSEQIREQRDQVRARWETARALPKGPDRDAALADAREFAEGHRADVEERQKHNDDVRARADLGGAVGRICDALAARPGPPCHSPLLHGLREILTRAAEVAEAEVEAWQALRTGQPDEGQWRDRVAYADANVRLAETLAEALGRASMHGGMWRP